VSVLSETSFDVGRGAEVFGIGGPPHDTSAAADNANHEKRSRQMTMT
jgi:hypothetical protein